METEFVRNCELEEGDQSSSNESSVSDEQEPTNSVLKIEKPPSKANSIKKSSL